MLSLVLHGWGDILESMKIDLQKIKALIEPKLIELGFSLVEARVVTDHGRLVLRIFIDKEGGPSVQDCQIASRGIERSLEEAGLFPDRCALEVSSPGIDRAKD
ncbi:MAG: hypothetical protein Q7S00_04930 [bacterium]|nr:hypothetical protein [bacterium]